MATASAYKDITFLIAGPKGDTGNGVASVTEYYLASASPSGVTVSTTGWTTAIQSLTAVKKYLWNYEVITYSDGSKTTTTPVIIGVYGDKGDTGSRGPALRGPREWSACDIGTKFYAGAEGEDYLDVVLYNNQYHVCKKAHVKSQINAPGTALSESKGLWQLGDKVELVAANILLSNYALIKNLGVEAVEMKDADGNVLFVVKDGVVTCKTGTFDNIAVQSGRVGGFNIDGMVLTNAGLNNDAAVLCKHSTYGVTAAIGANVTPGTGYRAVALFENHDTSNGVTTSLPNYAIRASARNTRNNIAIALDGGAVQGFAMRNVIVGTTATAGAIAREDYNVVALNSAQCQLTLPIMQLYDDGHVVRIKRLGNGLLNIKMSKGITYTDSGSGQLSTPVLRTASGGIVEYDDVHQLSNVGDAIELVWCRDVVTNYNGVTYYGAWVEYKLS